MSEIEKMQRYIERTKIPGRRVNAYQMDMQEAFELSSKAYTCSDLPVEMILLAFAYGRAKGYRAAKAEVRK